MKPSAFAEKYGWSIDRLARLFICAEETVCPYCDRRYKDLRDITIDIFDRALGPYFENTKVCCATDNKAKGKKTPLEWAEYCRNYRIRNSSALSTLDFYGQYYLQF